LTSSSLNGLMIASIFFIASSRMPSLEQRPCRTSGPVGLCESHT
jgi:hypothetical protein